MLGSELGDLATSFELTVVDDDGVGERSRSFLLGAFGFFLDVSSGVLRKGPVGSFGNGALKKGTSRGRASCNGRKNFLKNGCPSFAECGSDWCIGISAGCINDTCG